MDADRTAPRARLEFLDGIRGLAALFILLHHAAYEVAVPGMGLAAHAVRKALVDYGHGAVAVFIVLSGFSLMIPMARDPDGRLRGGVPGYLRRRARRILPPYYAALGLILTLIALTPGLRHPASVRWDAALPALAKGPVVSHLLLIHNLIPRHFFAIDPPMWSVATEWQIYFLFPVLLGFRRRLGIAATACAATLLGYLVAAGYLLTRDEGFLAACPWYVGLFALGMAGAVASAEAAERPGHLAARVPWGWLAAGFAGAAVVLQQVLHCLGYRTFAFAIDPLAGAAAMCLIVHCAGLRGRAGSALLRFLESRWAVGLGAFSYSLYLVHFPLLSLARLLIRDWALAPSGRLAVMLVIASPACLAAAYLFHLAFERRFMAASARMPATIMPAR